MDKRWKELADKIPSECYICGNKVEALTDLHAYGSHYICNSCTALVESQIEGLKKNKKAMVEYWQHYSKK